MDFNLMPLSLVISGLLVGNAAMAQNNLVIQPPAGGSVVVEDAAGNKLLLHIDENGVLQLPGVAGSAQQATILCINGASGQLGPCSAGTIADLEGPIGPTGPTGARGPEGLQGPKGSPGDIGPTGPMGIQGDVGPTGAMGSPGPTGPMGPTGAAGVYTIGTGLELNGDTLSLPTNCMDGAQLTWNATAASWDCPPVGPTGPTGPTGSTG